MPTDRWMDKQRRVSMHDGRVPGLKEEEVPIPAAVWVNPDDTP